MLVIVEGVFDGKAIILDEPLKLEPGSRVRARLYAAPSEADRERQREMLMRFANAAVDDDTLPADVASNMDKHLYGVTQQE